MKTKRMFAWEREWSDAIGPSVSGMPSRDKAFDALVLVVGMAGLPS